MTRHEHRPRRTGATAARTPAEPASAEAHSAAPAPALIGGRGENVLQRLAGPPRAGQPAWAVNQARYVASDGVMQRRGEGRGAGENRTGLPDALKSGVEALSGLSLDDVRVHSNSPDPDRLNAFAYAEGADIHLGPGQERHLPHEAWHVVQQKQGRVRPTLMAKGEAINDDDTLEREADAMGAQALRATAMPGPGPARIATAGRTAGAAPIQRVIQLGKKYDEVKAAAEKDGDAYDYEFKSVTEEAIAAGGEEIIREHMGDKRYTDREQKELASPTVQVSTKGGYGGVPGLLLVPNKVKSASDIVSGEFIPNMLHEFGHMVTGQKDSTAMQAIIAAIAKDAATEAKKAEHADVHPSPEAWVEECRADLTGVSIRFAAGGKPTLAEYKALSWADDAPDNEHPPGPYRIARIAELFEKLG